MTGPPPPPAPPAGTPLPGPPRWTTGSVVVWLLVSALFVWVATSGNQGTGWAWPITGAAVVVFVPAILLSLLVGRRHVRR